MVASEGLSVFTGFKVGGPGACSPGKNGIFRITGTLF